MLVNVSLLFKPFPAKAVHKQRVKLRPVEHHYEKEGEEPYIKYGCQICDSIAGMVKGLSLDENDGEGEFTRLSFTKGTPQCPCCGVNIDWEYKKTSE